MKRSRDHEERLPTAVTVEEERRGGEERVSLRFVRPRPLQEQTSKREPSVGGRRTLDRLLQYLRCAYDEEKKEEENVKRTMETLVALLEERDLPDASEWVDALIYVAQGKNAGVQILAARVLGRFATVPGVDVSTVVGVLLSLSRSGSQRVRRQAMRTLLPVGRALTSERERIVQRAMELVRDPDVCLRQAAVALVARLANITERSGVEIQDILSLSIRDPDPRVRRVVFGALEVLHLRGVKLDIRLYEEAVHGLHDDESRVRLGAMKLLWIISNTYSTQAVSGAGGDQLLMADDGFAQLCSMVNDPDVGVRTQACSLLGSLRGMSSRSLLQAFNKDWGRKAKAGDPPASIGATSDSKPEGDTDVVALDVNLMERGTTAAFVYGLEDEFFEVRTAAIDSVCELSLRDDLDDEFALRAVDCLIDMFNDEIESVRENAITSVSKIGARVQVNEGQLHVILECMEDASPTIRGAVHRLLGGIRMVNVTCLHATVQGLLANMSRNPSDVGSIYRTFQQLGQSHAWMAEFLVEGLLRIDPHFLPREPDCDDMHYAGILVFLFNACRENRSILPLLPGFTIRHYKYLRDKFPALFPDLQVMHLAQGIVEHELVDSPKKEVEQGEDPSTPHGLHAFCERTLEIIQTMQTMLQEKNLDGVERLARDTERDLRRVAGLDKRCEALAEFYLLYLECLRVILVLKREASTTSTLLDVISSSRPSRRLLHLSYRMEHGFLGLPFTVQLHLRQLRILSHILHLLSSLSQGSCSGTSTELADVEANDLRALCCRSEELARFAKAHEISLPDDTRQLIQDVSMLHNRVDATSNIVHHLCSLVVEYIPTFPQIRHPIKRTCATIIQPVSNAEKPIDYTAILPLEITVEALLCNVMTPQDVYVQVVTPDHQVLVFTPPPRDFTPLRPMEQRLRTIVRVNLEPWTDPSPLRVSLLRRYTIDQEDETLIVPGGGESGGGPTPTSLALSQPVEFHVHPVRPSRIPGRGM